MHLHVTDSPEFKDILQYKATAKLLLLQLGQKPDIITHFGNPTFYISEFYIPKPLFCSNINAVLQIVFKSQGYIAK